ncbi:MAG: ankyrin repeat domain-containing protein [Bacteroidetes bacterium]|nr:ankyrin repeat domain-containing protein [Bacteroidota bacterium]
MRHSYSISRWIGICILCLPTYLSAQGPHPTATSATLSAHSTAPHTPPAPDTTLFRIIRSGDLPTLQKHLSSGANPNETLDGFSALMIAALSGTTEEMKVLLDHGANPNYANADSLTALWMAVPNEEKTLLLLDHGANPNMLSKEHYTPLVKLVSFPGATPLLKAMIAHGADPKHCSPKPILLYQAATTNDTVLLGALLDMGFNPNDSTSLGDYPINNATVYRTFLTLKMLVDHGANVNVSLPHTFLPPLAGLTPLMLTGLNDDEPSFFYLLEHGADVNAKCAKGYTALMCLQQAEIDHPTLTQALLEHGALASIKAKDGTDAISLARKKGYTRSVQLLQSSAK